MGLAREIKSFLKGEVSEKSGILEKYSRDASLFEVKPQLVVFPKNTEDLKSLVKFVQKKASKSHKLKANKLSLTARAAGTDMTGGPLSESIVLDFTKHFNKIKKIGKNYAIVEPGVYYRDFEKATLKKKLLLPSYPASKEICALGGMVANNSGGEKTLAYGKTEDYIEELKVVLADGNEYAFGPLALSELKKKLALKNFEGEIHRKIYNLIIDNFEPIKKARPRVSKNSSGYALWNIFDGKKFNLAKLFVGAQGTLGLITQVKVRLIKPKKYSRILVIFLKDIGLLSEVVKNVLKSKPESFESYDDHTLRLAMRYLFWKFAFQFLPEAWLFLKSGFKFPKLVLLAEFTDDSLKEALKKALNAQKILEKFSLPTRITTSDKDAQKYWTIRRESFNLLRTKIKNKKTAPFIDDIIVNPKNLPEFLPKLEQILKKYDITYTIAGHIGDGNLHIIPLVNLKDEKTRKIIPELASKVYDLVFQFHGSMSAEHNDGLIRTPYIEKMFGKYIYALFKKTKNIFDPNNIFNPHKKINTDLAYSFKYLKKK